MKWWGHPDSNRESRFRTPELYPFKRWPRTGPILPSSLRLTEEELLRTQFFGLSIQFVGMRGQELLPALFLFCEFGVRQLGILLPHPFVDGFHDEIPDVTALVSAIGRDSSRFRADLVVRQCEYEST